MGRTELGNKNYICSNLYNWVSISVLFLSIIQIVSAQSDTWQFVGLQEESVSAIEINWENDSIVYAGTYSNFSSGTFGAIFKSVDYGISWDTLLYGLSCTDLTIHPINSNIIYAALGSANNTQPGIIKVDDSTGNWEYLNNGLYLDWETTVSTIVIDPTNPNTMYTGTGGFYGGFAYKSINGGETWQRISTPEDTDNPIYLTGVLDLEINPINHLEILACGNMPSDIYRSTDGGENWYQIFGDVPDHLIYDIEIDPFETTTYYAPIPKYGLIKVINSGGSWELKNVGLSDSSTKFIELSPINSDELYLAIGGKGIYKSVDGGNNWIDWNENFNDYFIEALAISPTGDVLFCGTQSGIYKRTIPALGINNIGNIPNIEILKNYPNPFNEQTSITYTIYRSGRYKISVYDILGKHIISLCNQFHRPGEYTINWDGLDKEGYDLPSGIYIYSLVSEKTYHRGKMVLLK